MEYNNLNNLNEDDVRLNKDLCIRNLNSLLENYISNPLKIKKANDLSYWLCEYSNHISFEDNFDPKRLISYKRGDVIKANLGFNIGNEEGGLHYCIVLDNLNSRASGTLTVIPLTSAKEGKKYHFSTVPLGDEIYLNLKNKYTNAHKNFIEKFEKVFSVEKKKMPITKEENDLLSIKINEASEEINFINKIGDEIAHMKKGSIALVGQISTISKQRIYNPQRAKDILSGLKISSKSLDLIDSKIKELYNKK